MSGPPQSSTRHDEAPDKANVIALPPLIVAVFVLVGFMADWLIQIPGLPLGPSRWLGAILVAIAGANGLWAKSRMRSKGTPVNPLRPTTAMVTDGPFRFSRNPLYVSLSLLYLGIAILAGSVSLLILAIPLVIVLQKGVIEREERYLEHKFGDEYLRYKKSVRRWI
jgi:protein-S-isoprenylcysteine O-methyltransferase Ste14